MTDVRWVFTGHICLTFLEGNRVAPPGLHRLHGEELGGEGHLGGVVGARGHLGAGSFFFFGKDGGIVRDRPLISPVTFVNNYSYYL